MDCLVCLCWFKYNRKYFAVSFNHLRHTPRVCVSSTLLWFSSNILLDSEMKARISDFGLIRSSSSELSNRTSTQTSNPIGTGVYMAHEAYSGTVSYAMDVFSFGVVSR